jgi:hypothetical protein
MEQCYVCGGTGKVSLRHGDNVSQVTCHFCTGSATIVSKLLNTMVSNYATLEPILSDMMEDPIVSDETKKVILEWFNNGSVLTEVTGFSFSDIMEMSKGE